MKRPTVLSERTTPERAAQYSAVSNPARRRANLRRAAFELVVLAPAEQPIVAPSMRQLLPPRPTARRRRRPSMDSHPSHSRTARRLRRRRAEPVLRLFCPYKKAMAVLLTGSGKWPVCRTLRAAAHIRLDATVWSRRGQPSRHRSSRSSRGAAKSGLIHWRGNAPSRRPASRQITIQKNVMANT